MMCSLLISLSGVWFDTTDISVAETSPHSVFVMIAAAFVVICGLMDIIIGYEFMQFVVRWPKADMLQIDNVLCSVFAYR